MDNAGMPGILLGSYGLRFYPWGVFKRCDLAGPITAPVLDSGVGYPDKFFFGAAYGIAPSAPQPNPKAAPIDVGFPFYQSAPVMKNGEIWSVLNAVDAGLGRGVIHWLEPTAAPRA